MDDGAGSRELSGPGVMASLPSDVASAYLGGGGEAAVVALKAYLDSEVMDDDGVCVVLFYNISIL